MAREVVIRSDVSGEPGARTYTLAFDGEQWQVDLTPGEAEPIMQLFRHGSQTPATEGGSRGVRSLERRIRNAPPVAGDT